MRRIVMWLAALALLAAFAVPAYADGGGTIQGNVVNATANGGSVAGVEVTLTAYFGQTERNKVTTKTDANGNFQFTGLDTDSNYSYEAGTTYQKADYTADRVSFSGSNETKQVTLKVYDSTDKADAVKASAKQYLLSFGNGGVQVSETLVLNNGTDKSYIGSKEVGPDQRETSRYLPPSGAKNVQYGDTLMSCCVVQQGAGFVDTMAINPGEVQKIYSYALPYSGTTLSFTSVLQQDVDQVQVLVPDTGAKASISGLANHGSQTLQGVNYQVFSAQKMPANTNIDVKLENLPTSGPLGEGSLVLIAIGGAALTALAVAFYVLRKRSQPAPRPAHAMPHGAPYSYYPVSKKERRAPAAGAALLELERRDVLSAMANLDDAFEAGQIGRKEYERLRAEKKRRLTQLMQKSGEEPEAIRRG